MRAWRRVPPAVALMVTVAAAHQLVGGAGRLSPWKGGGFGMFATIESPAARFVRVHLVTDRARFAASIPPHLSVDAARLRTWPAEERARRIAHELARLRWVTVPTANPLAAPLAPGDDSADAATAPAILPYRGLLPNERVPPGARLLRVDKVEVDVWRYRVGGQTSPFVVRASPIVTVAVHTHE